MLRRALELSNSPESAEGLAGVLEAQGRPRNLSSSTAAPLKVRRMKRRRAAWRGLLRLKSVREIRKPPCNFTGQPW